MGFYAYSAVVFAAGVVAGMVAAACYLEERINAVLRAVQEAFPELKVRLR